MSLNVSSRFDVSRSSIPAQTDSFTAKRAVDSFRELARGADGFVAPAPRRAVELAGVAVKIAPALPTASLESLFAPKAAALSLASGGGSLPTVPQAQGASIDQVRGEITNNIVNSEEYQKLHGRTLPNDPNHSFTFQELYPTIQKYAAKYGTDPKVLAAIVDQESSFTNWIVHRDGTGHGLTGLDDGGLKPDFERWVRQTKGIPDYTVGNGGDARSIEPDWQMEYLAKTISELTNKYNGNIMAAAREWHTGAGGVWSGEGDLYESLIRQRMQELFG